MRRGDQRAFNEFFDTFAPRLSSFAVRRSSLDPAAIEDVVQMTMISAMRNFGSYRGGSTRSEEHTSELQSRRDLVCRLLLEEKKASPAVFRLSATFTLR